MNVPSAAIIGADSGLGRALRGSLSSTGSETLLTSRRSALSPNTLLLDLAQDPDAWDLPGRVEVAFLCAAITSQAACADSPVATAQINVEATFQLARRLHERGAFLVFPSTNLVFDGQKPRTPRDAQPNPCTEYGRQKLAAEHLLGQLERVAIVRFGKLLPRVFPLFRQWREALKQGQTVRAFTDLRIAPLPLDFAADALAELGMQQQPGVYQLSGDEDISYYDIARRMARTIGVSQSLVVGESAAASGMFRAVPQHSTLDTSGNPTGLVQRIPCSWTTIERCCASSGEEPL